MTETFYKTYYRVTNSKTEIMWPLIVNKSEIELSKSDNFSLENQKGGLHFCKLKDVVKMINSKRNGYIYEVKIPAHAQIYKCSIGYATNHMIVSNPQRASDFIRMHNLENELVEHNGLNIRLVTYQTKDLCLKAVKNNGLALRYCLLKDADICYAAVMNNSDAFDYVPDSLSSKVLVLLKGKDKNKYVCENTETNEWI